MPELPLSLARAHAELAWPNPNAIRKPSGSGPKVFAALARDKIGRALSAFKDSRDAVVGILAADPNTTDTEPPLAIVVEFKRQVSDETLRELQRLAWNFSHSPALVTVEPSFLRIWTCCEAPNPNRTVEEYVVHQLEPTDLTARGRPILERRAARSLHWLNLASGDFFKQHAPRFNRDGRADQMLLSNLRQIRSTLEEAGLEDDDIAHDLLARIIFVQFLCDRKDTDGNAALTPAKLARLRLEGVLKKQHRDLAGILTDFDETYRLFDWLNERFNGDLFPGKGDTPAARARGWSAEKRSVKKHHLAILADFIRGNLNLGTGQLSLWPAYAFDVIPLEFISSIYETFVTQRAAKEGIFYTPPHLVDFVLDRVLPWEGDTWDLKILDPACGSGIFLVKAFQRLIYRWKKKNPGQQIRAQELRRLLERNVFGVDKDPHAVRVACFSLYLAMCDEIDPRHYWSQVVFPPMRNERLVCSDFFEEDRAGFKTNEDAASYDLIIGNAPWGEKLLTEAARKWASDADRQWPLANQGIGTLFLPKAACLIKDSGKVAIIQSASSLIFNRQSRAAAFRARFFNTYTVEEVINLSALRFKVFKRKKHATKTSVSPACIVVFSKVLPEPDDRISYVSPKHTEPLLDEFQIVIEPSDERVLTVREAANDESAWVSLMWGSKRDRALVRKLRSFPSIVSLGEMHALKHREGIIFGDRKKPQPQLRDRRVLQQKNFPDGLLHLRAELLPKLADVETDSRASTDFTAFALPQLIIKQGWQKKVSRFQARLTQSSEMAGVLCTQSYITVHETRSQSSALEAACLSFNSMVATYFLLLTSGRFASYRPEPLVEELLSVPFPIPESGLLHGIENQDQLDERAFASFGLRDAEKALIEDLFTYTLPDFKGDHRSLGRQPTPRMEHEEREPYLSLYCTYFLRVLRAAFGQDKAIHATIFQEDGNHARLPYRLVAFELGSDKVDISTIPMRLPELLKELERVNNKSNGNIYRQRIVRVYETLNEKPTIFVIKPDMRSYWTRSAALNDADEVASDLFQWTQAAFRSEVA